MRRAALMREEIGDERKLMMDANQCWDVPEAIEQIKALARFNPWWIEEPTSPDDVLGHATIARAAAPLRIATGAVRTGSFSSNFCRLRQSDFCRLTPAGLEASTKCSLSS